MLLLPLLLGCAGGPAASDCDALAPDVCATTAGCAVIDGGLLDPPGVTDTGASCWTEVASASVGCRADDGECPPVEAYAADPEDGSCWAFTEGCVPAGWGACETEPASICP